MSRLIDVPGASAATTFVTLDSLTEIRYQTGDDPDVIKKRLFIPGTADGKFARIAVWNGHQFESMKTFYTSYLAESGSHLGEVVLNPRRGGTVEFVMTMYHPIDPRITPTDVDGAVRAYKNADSTGWLFAHTEEGTHHDYELTLRAAADGLFQPLFRQLQVDAFTPSLRARSEERFKLMSEFYGEVLVAARDIARGAFLGEREQSAHPREGWLDRDLTAALAATKKKWQADRADDLVKIATSVSYAETVLAMPTVETRWDRAARLAEEAKKKAAAEESAAENSG